MGKNYVVLFECKNGESEVKKVECQGSVVSEQELCNLIGCERIQTQQPPEPLGSDFILVFDADQTKQELAPNPLASILYGYCRTGKYLRGNVVYCRSNEAQEILACSSFKASSIVMQMDASKAMASLVDFKVE